MLLIRNQLSIKSNVKFCAVILSFSIFLFNILSDLKVIYKKSIFMDFHRCLYIEQRLTVALICLLFLLNYDNCKSSLNNLCLPCVWTCLWCLCCTDIKFQCPRITPKGEHGREWKKCLKYNPCQQDGEERVSGVDPWGESAFLRPLSL